MKFGTPQKYGKKKLMIRIYQTVEKYINAIFTILINLYEKGDNILCYFLFTRCIIRHYSFPKTV